MYQTTTWNPFFCSKTVDTPLTWYLSLSSFDPLFPPSVSTSEVSSSTTEYNSIFFSFNTLPRSKPYQTSITSFTPITPFFLTSVTEDVESETFIHLQSTNSFYLLKLPHSLPSLSLFYVLYKT